MSLLILVEKNNVHSIDTSNSTEDVDQNDDFNPDGDDENIIDGNASSSAVSDRNTDGENSGTVTGVTAEETYAVKLVDDNSRNILIIGEDKGEQKSLYDTIGVISINKKDNKVKIIMIPRDTYIEYNSKVLSFLKEVGRLNEPGIFKINYSHNIGYMMKHEGKFGSYTTISFLSDVIEEKFGIKIDDFIRVNTEGFVEIVDLFGGVDINVPYDMNYDDPKQNLAIHLEKGMQHLDGEQAEGFVRFRQGHDSEGKEIEPGDIGRKQNQIAFLKTFFNQHGTIANVDKIPKLIGTLSRNVRHSIGAGDVLFTYIGMFKDAILNKYEIESITLNGKLKMIKGSSYIIIE